MTDNFSLTTFLRSALGENVSVEKSSPISGGCIHNAQKISLADGRTFFLKENQKDSASLLATEFEGLRRLEATGVVNVPSPIQWGTEGNSSFLLMEWIEPGSSSSRSSARLGEMLAQLHLAEDNAQFGLEFNNFIGSTPQANKWCNNWAEFFVTWRIKPQIELARNRGYSFSEIKADSFWQKLETLLSVNPAPSLLHGDLWSGNYLIDQSGQPYLIDPAPYWGHHEAEFGILTMFGGFEPAFFDAYHTLIPQAEGFAERLRIYQLYHYLNHLNLFGGSYLGQCQRLLRAI